MRRGSSRGRSFGLTRSERHRRARLRVPAGGELWHIFAHVKFLGDRWTVGRVLKWLIFRRDMIYARHDAMQAEVVYEEEQWSFEKAENDYMKRFPPTRGDILKNMSQESIDERRRLDRQKSAFVMKRNLARQQPAIIETDYLKSLADDYVVPVPDWADAEWLQQGDKRYLDIVGRHALRSAIRKEIKERFDVVQGRLALIFGLVGAITGTISLLKLIL